MRRGTWAELHYTGGCCTLLPSVVQRMLRQVHTHRAFFTGPIADETH